MPPFFPGVKVITRSRRGSPTPTARSQYSDQHYQEQHHPPLSRGGNEHAGGQSSLPDRRRNVDHYSSHNSASIPTVPEELDFPGDYDNINNNNNYIDDKQKPKHKHTDNYNDNDNDKQKQKHTDNYKYNDDDKQKQKQKHTDNYNYNYNYNYNEPGMPHNDGARDRARDAGRDAGLDSPRPAGTKPDRLVNEKHRSSTSSSPIYEHTLLLRKHGAAVSFTSSGFMTAMAKGPAPQASSRKTPLNMTETGYVDAYNPNASEIKLLDQALGAVLYHGGDVEFLPLTADPFVHTTPTTVKCLDCHALFPSERERENHYNDGQTVCRICSLSFDCQGLLCNHLREGHSIPDPDKYLRENQKIASSTASNFDSYNSEHTYRPHR